jgi:hypothetical protein
MHLPNPHICAVQCVGGVETLEWKQLAAPGSGDTGIVLHYLLLPPQLLLCYLNLVLRPRQLPC